MARAETRTGAGAETTLHERFPYKWIALSVTTIGALMAARIVNGSRVGDPVELFPLSGSRILRHFDVMPDGERFLVGETIRPPQINVVLNWFEELKAKVPPAW